MQRVVIATLAVFIALVATPLATADNSKPLSPLPEKLSVKDALAIVQRGKITSIACGRCTWNGQPYGLEGKSYRPLVVPWSSKPEVVSVRFAYGGGERHLYRFTVMGATYSRSSDVPELTLEKKAD